MGNTNGGGSDSFRRETIESASCHTRSLSSSGSNSGPGDHHGVDVNTKQGNFYNNFQDFYNKPFKKCSTEPVVVPTIQWSITLLLKLVLVLPKEQKKHSKNNSQWVCTFGLILLVPNVILQFAHCTQTIQFELFWSIIINILINKKHICFWFYTNSNNLKKKL